jgi:hypothetical protein
LLGGSIIVGQRVQWLAVGSQKVRGALVRILAASPSTAVLLGLLLLLFF